MIANVVREHENTMVHAEAVAPARCSDRAPMPVRTEADDARFRALVDAHYDTVWRTLRGLGVPASSADDAAQHVFLIALQKLGRIAAGSDRSFLLGTAVGVAANARRGLSRRREVADPEAMIAHVDPSPDPEQQAVLRQRQELLERVLDTMPEDLRTVFVLFELEGATSIEIADALAIPTGTATSRLRRAREHFQAQVARAGASSRTRNP